MTITLNATNLKTKTTTETRDGREIVTLMVNTKGLPVDRTDLAGWSVKDHVMAARLSMAVLDGKVFGPGTIKTDVNGKTYVTADSNVWGRRMNADLKRLGY